MQMPWIAAKNRLKELFIMLSNMQKQ